MKTKIHFFYYILGLLFLFATGCQKDQVHIETKWERGDPQSVNEVRIIFAQTLAKALSDEPLRKYIHERMLRAYHTDYEMVYIAEKNNIIYAGKTLADILKSYADPEVLETYGDNFFVELTNISPLLSITMPELTRHNANTWNVASIPQVAAVLEGHEYTYRLFRGQAEVQGGISFRNDDDDYFNETTLGIWDAEAHYLIKRDGVTSWGTHIDKHMPNKSDATIQEKSICQSLLQSALDALDRYIIDNDEYHLISHQTLLQLYLDCLGLEGDVHGGDGSGNQCTEPCERDCERLPETLVKFKINGWGVFENIRNQPFENRYVFHGDVLGALRNSLGQITPHQLKLVTPALRKRDLLNCDNRPCQGRWISVNFRVLADDWDISRFADPYYVDWVEVDNGTTTVSFGVGLSFKFKVKLDDNTEAEIGANLNFGISRTGAAIVPLGRQSVDYCAPILFPNDTGSVTFKCD